MNIIKESFDNLPMALCFFNRRGIACLVNRRMLWVSTQLLGSSVQTLSAGITAGYRGAAEHPAAYLSIFGRLHSAVYPRGNTG